MAEFERCWCTGVSREQVIAAIHHSECRTFEAVRRASGACFGCQSCRPELERLLAQVRPSADQATGRFPAPPSAGDGSPGPGAG